MPLITAPIDDHQLITLSGNTHPLARAQFDTGAVPDDTPLNRMLLVLSRSPEQDAALQKLLDDQQTPGSPQFRQWLTPPQFGQMFGPADADIQTVTSWLSSQGFHVDQVSAARNIIQFSGNAGQVRQAFHTSLHHYLFNGKNHLANASDPQIPAALAPVIKGIATLNNFERKSYSRLSGLYSRNTTTGQIEPQFTLTNGSETYYALGPADFATIYNTSALQQSGINGTGETIAIAGRTDINLQDVSDFRNLFGLGTSNTSLVIDGPDPGVSTDDEFESILDVEWANAAAPQASVMLVSAADTETTSGIDLAALHIVDSNLAGVMSLSYGLCEVDLGNTENQFIQSLWQQAAAQGITVVVSTGDNGSAGCDDFNTATQAEYGLAVSGYASTPFNVAAGGTDFNDATTASQYWSTTNTPGSELSAKSYIPEMTWNDSCAASASTINLNVCPVLPSGGSPPDGLNIIAASGGASSCSTSTGLRSGLVCQGTPKPAWQSGVGVPNDSVRDVPDISLFSAINSASNSFYVTCQADAVPSGYPSCQLSSGYIYFLGAGGTSVAAPDFAGIIAMAEQKAGTRLGNVNYLLYSLAAQSGSSCVSSKAEAAACIFNDVTQGNNTVPCPAGSPNCSVTTGSATGVLIGPSGAPAYAAASGYDLATGLGSVNGGNLVNALAKAASGFKPTTTTLALNGAATQVTAKHGDPIGVAVNVTPTTATGSVSLLGSNGGIDNAALSGGLASWSSTLFPGGNYSVTAHYPGDGARAASNSNGVPVSISPESSQTFANLVTFDLNGNLQSFTANTAAYGSPYVFRMDVADAAATLSPTQGISSKCSNKTASCPTGTLTVTANGAPLDAGSFPLNSAGIAEDVRIQLSPGSYNIAASYPGDPSYTASKGNTSVSITQAPVTVTASSSQSAPYTYGSFYQLFATVGTTSNGVAPTGTVTFFDNGDPISPNYISYQGSAFNASQSPPYASFTANIAHAFASLGSHSLTAQYSGDANYAGGVSSPFTFNIVQATPSFVNIGPYPNPATPLLPVTMSVNVRGTAAAPTGTVTFADNGVPLPGTVTYQSASSTLIASLTYTFTQPGTHSLSANYSGDTNYTAGTQSLGPLIISSQIATTLPVVTSAFTPALVNYPVQLSAIVTGQSVYDVPNLTGTVTFSDNGTPISTGNVVYTAYSNDLQATLSYSFSATGAHSITAQYSGDSIYAASQSAQALSLPVVSALTPSVNPPSAEGITPVVNQPVTLSTYISANTGGPPLGGGTVTFLDNGTPLAGNVTVTSPNQNVLQASLTYTFTTTGVHNITAEYGGDSNYSSAQSFQPLALSVEGPLWINLQQTQGTFTSSGGTGTLFFSVDNNTASATSITMTCTSDSNAATCNPATMAAGELPYRRAYYTFTITVPALSGARHSPPSLWTKTSGLFFCGVFIGAGLLDRRRRKVLLLLLIVLFIFTLLSCGGGGGGNTGGGVTTPPPTTPTSQTYHFTITATGGGNTNSQVFTATVQ